MKAQLAIEQKGKCYACGKTLLNKEGEMNYDGSTHIHHVKPRAKKGSKSLKSNLRLVHAECHIDLHKSSSPRTPETRMKRKSPIRKEAQTD